MGPVSNFALAITLNSTAPDLLQATQAAFDGAASSAIAIGGAARTGAILYVDGNPYNNGGTVQNQQNFTTYNQLYANNWGQTPIIPLRSGSNSTDPSFIQATQADLEAAASATVGGAARTGAILYVDGNPYNNGGTLQNQQNFTTYNQLYLNAQGAYTPIAADDGITYFTHTGAGSNWGLVGAVIQSAPETGDFQGAKALSNGQGAVITTVTQNAAAVAHLENLRTVAGSNSFVTAYVRPTTEGMLRLSGQIALNQAYNTSAQLDTSQYGPAFMSGVGDIQGQTLLTGNEAGFWATGTGSNTQIANWGDGSPNSIAAAFNPNAQFHVHTHTSNGSVPSVQDMLASAMLGGMPGMVVSGSSSSAYGFRLETGWLPTPEGQIVFNQRDPRVNDGNMSGYDSYGREKPGGYSDRDRTGDFTTHAAVGIAGAAMMGGFTSIARGLGSFALGVIGVATGSDVMTHTPWSDYDGGWNQDQRDYDGRPSPDRSYTDNGHNYGGPNGNTSPDGSAINGLD